MNKEQTKDFAQLTTDIRELIASQQTLLLSTASESGVPGISYAPFVYDKAGDFYIFISDLASHTANLLSNPQASILFIRPESESRNLFARERLVLACSVTEIACDNPVYTIQLQALQEKFGDIINILRSLSDFRLLALSPKNGRYVVGFGKAFTITIHDNTLTLSHSKA